VPDQTFIFRGKGGKEKEGGEGRNEGEGREREKRERESKCRDDSEIGLCSGDDRFHIKSLTHSR
jgi:hypothetical protein